MNNWYTEVSKEIPKLSDRELLELILDGQRKTIQRYNIYLIKKKKNKKGLEWEVQH